MGGARAVITNFFHGCIFALLHGKPWAAAPSDYRAIKIPDLATILGARHRLIDQKTRQGTVEDLLQTPVEPAVAARIDELRHQSDAFLNEALS